MWAFRRNGKKRRKNHEKEIRRNYRGEKLKSKKISYVKHKGGQSPKGN